MLLTGQRRDSRLTACLAAAPAFGRTAGQARTMIDHQYEVIMREWGSVYDEAGLSLTERGALWQSIKNDLTTMFWHRDARAIGHSYGGYLLMHALAELGAFPGRILLLSRVLGTGT